MKCLRSHRLRLRLRLRLALACLLLGVGGSVLTLDTATIIASALSPDCFAWKVVGLCYWLDCGAFGCTVRTSVKVRHYIPDAVVSSYAATGANPGIEMRLLSVPNPSAQAGGDSTTNQDHENNLTKFKNADVIGHPAGRCSVISPASRATPAPARRRRSCITC